MVNETTKILGDGYYELASHLTGKRVGTCPTGVAGVAGVAGAAKG
jgi:hypothetical protein